MLFFVPKFKKEGDKVQYIKQKRRFCVTELILRKRPTETYEAVDGLIEVYVTKHRVIEVPKEKADKIRAAYRT